MTSTPSVPGLALFDLDGVIRRFDPGVADQLEIDHGLAPGSLRRAAFDHPRGTAVVLGHMTRAAWVAEIGVEVGAPRAAEIWLGTRGSVDADTAAVVTTASAAGMTTAILTNGTDTIGEELADLDIATLADHVFCSAVIGLAKPDAEAYLHVCGAVGVEPADVTFFDDAAANVEGARAAGLRAHLFTGAAAAGAVLGI